MAACDAFESSEVVVAYLLVGAIEPFAAVFAPLESVLEML